jgi:hypothetical protein
MSYTKNINYQETCNYINPEKDNAISMLKTCINDPNYTSPTKDLNPGDFCHGKSVENIDYKYGDNYPLENLKYNKSSAIDNKNHINKLQDDLINYLSSDNNKYLTELNDDNSIHFEGYWTGDNTKRNVEFKDSKPDFPNFLPPKKIPLQQKLQKFKEEEIILKDGKQIEGFMAGDFNSNNGPGEQYIDVCPDEYELENGICVKKCDHCNTNYDNSDYTDVCYPYHYDGIDNFGRIMCSTTEKINDDTIRISTQWSNINSKEQLFSHHDDKTVYNINNYYL